MRTLRCAFRLEIDGFHWFRFYQGKHINQQLEAYFHAPGNPSISSQTHMTGEDASVHLGALRHLRAPRPFAAEEPLRGSSLRVGGQWQRAAEASTTKSEQFGYSDGLELSYVVSNPGC